MKSRFVRQSLGLLNSVGISALFAGAVLSSPAQAQQAPVTVAAAAPPEQVVVTGSRIGTPGFTTPTPVTEISPLQYEVKQAVNVVDIMRDIPSLTPNQNASDAFSIGASSFNLRNLGALRTLVLVNGQRTEFTSVSGGYDVNVLPASLIQRIDVVTGGASAAYGSDAVAGVVNVTLNTTLNGFVAKAGAGESTYGDDVTMTASAAWGGDFAGGRGHVVIGGDYFNQAGVYPQGSRSWGRSGAAVLANPSCPTGAGGCAQLLRVTGSVASKMTDGGVILGAKTAGGGTSSALTNIQFGQGGVPSPFTVGQFAGGTYMVGGDGSNQAQYMGLQASERRINVLGHATYDLTDDVSVWSQFLYARSSAFYPIVPNFNSGNLTVSAQNAFIPASIQSIIAANNITSFTMGRSNIDLAPIAYGRDLTYGRNDDYDGSAGVKGHLNVLSTDWSWDLSAQYDAHLFVTTVGQNQINQNWLNSVDSVRNPTVGGVAGVPAGQAVCRSTLTNPANGCVPVNLFGLNTITPAVTAYTTGTGRVNAEMDMFDTSANLHGQPFSTWAGPVSVATGFEYRRQTTASFSDPISAVSGFRNGDQVPFKGAYSVEEGYLEVDTPLAKDLPFAQALDVDTAARMTSYSTSGGVTTWKVGINYSPTDDIRLRGTRSHDIRAPDLTELYQAGNGSVGGVIQNPVTGVQAVANGVTVGNPNLKPEIGDTITGGIVYTPSWLDRFNISVDYWNIKMTSVLTRYSAQQIVNNCFAGQSQFCPAISFDPVSGIISSVESTQFNASILKTDGYDLEAGYQFDMDSLDKDWAGTMMLHFLGTYVDHYISTGSSGIPVDEAGCVGACSNPRIRWNMNAIYLNDPWTLSVTGNWIAGGVFDQLYSGKYTAAAGAKSINDNTVNGRFYLNMSAAYQLSDAWQLWVRADNVLNSNPPLIPDTLGFQHIQQAGTVYDKIGTQFLAGVKLRLN